MKTSPDHFADNRGMQARLNYLEQLLQRMQILGREFTDAESVERRSAILAEIKSIAAAAKQGAMAARLRNEDSIGKCEKAADGMIQCNLRQTRAAHSTEAFEMLMAQFKASTDWDEKTELLHQMADLRKDMIAELWL